MVLRNGIVCLNTTIQRQGAGGVIIKCIDLVLSYAVMTIGEEHLI